MTLFTPINTSSFLPPSPTFLCSPLIQQCFLQQHFPQANDFLIVDTIFSSCLDFKISQQNVTPDYRDFPRPGTKYMLAN